MVIKYKKGHNNSEHIDEDELDGEEARWFILFLEEELERHTEAIMKADSAIKCYSRNPVYVQAYTSSIKGHQEDNIVIEESILKLRQKFNIKNGRDRHK